MDIITVTKTKSLFTRSSEEEPSSAKASAGLVTPGDMVTNDASWMRGHGTYFYDDITYSSVVGLISRVNRLLSVTPLRGRFMPDVGDHVVGRIVEVGQKKWKVDIGARQHASLMLGSINLPGGILRRKSDSDELQMRSFLREGDLLNAEVQNIYADGGAALHTRSLKYGKLRNGMFVSVPSSLIIRSKVHSHLLPGNVSVIFGVNGYIWVSKTTDEANKRAELGGSSELKGSSFFGSSANVSISRLEQESSWDIYSDENEQISATVRAAIARYVCCIYALAKCEVGIDETRLVAAYEASLAYENASSLTEREVYEAVCEDVLAKEQMNE